MAQLRLAKSRFEEAGLQVALVGMGTAAESAAFKKKFDVPFPIVADPLKKIYRAFGLKSMSPWGFFSPTIALKGLVAISQGYTIGMPRGDISQLSGVFVINCEGHIVYSHSARDASDHPEPDTILEATKNTP